MAGDFGVSSPQPSEWVKGKIIGSGSFGTVHLAMNKSNGSLFVVKSAESQAGIQSLLNEAEILENLNSPHIIQCIGSDLHKGSNGDQKMNFFIEYIAGGSLADVAENFGGKFEEEVIRLYTKEILEGLKYLHGKGIVHCDLKCQNILLGLSGNIKLADFGCARRIKIEPEKKVSAIKSCKSISGTPLWMAPEVLRNEDLDFSADIWSLGCTVIEMATGIPPWSDCGISNPMAAVLKIASSNEKPKFPSHFSKVGIDFLDKCLERNPKKRSNIEELLNHPFVTGKSDIEMDFGNENVSSPLSVLDFGTSNGDYDSDSDSDSEEEEEEEESRDENGIMGRIPFSTRCYGDRKLMSQKPCWEKNIQLDSSENWVTVRAG